jgi:ESCRT-II complex subunit VPS22
MRKGAGISGLTRQTATSANYSALSTTLSTQQLASLSSSLESFRETLIAFAAAHRADIRKDPAFRHQFQKMCAAIGVDPLAGAKSGRGAWWAEQLGRGEWAAELALQVVDVCVSTRERNGGIIEMGELIARVERMRRGGEKEKDKSTAPSTTPDTATITPDDIVRALDLLRPLKAGYSTHTLGGLTYVRSTPRELDTDMSMLLVLAAGAGRLTQDGVVEATGWTSLRARTALDDCVMRHGLGWVDEQDEGAVWVVAAVEFEE